MKNPLYGDFAGAPIVGVTSTYYPDRNDPRFEISLETAEEWRKRGLPLVVVDGTPLGEKDGNEEASIASAYRERGALVLRSITNGIASQRQQGGFHARLNGAEKILTLEPEKTRMAQFAIGVARQLDDNEIVVVGRTEASIDSLPPVQRRTELLAGWLMQKCLSLPPDTLAGPRGYSIDGMHHLFRYPSYKPGMDNWLYMYTNILDAKAGRQSVGNFEADLIYPNSMVEQESGNPAFDAKRYMQFMFQLDYMLRLPQVRRRKALEIARTVLDAFKNLPPDPSNEVLASMIKSLESKLAHYGYRVPA